MSEESTIQFKYQKFFGNMQLPPLRGVKEFFFDMSRFGIPPFFDLPKWNNRMLTNLLYYQTNYFAIMLGFILIGASLQLWDIIIGLIAISCVAVVFILSFSSSHTFVQTRRKHAFLLLGAFLLSFYLFIHAIMPVVTVLFTLSLPSLLVLVHASIRRRNLKAKVTHQLERMGLKNTFMAYMLEQAGIEMIAPNMPGSVFQLVYGHFLQKSLLDETDVDIIEEYYVATPKESLPLKFIVCVSIVLAAIAGGYSVSYLKIILLVSPIFIIGFWKLVEWLCYYIVYSFTVVSFDYDSTVHRIVAAIRSREIAFFGLRHKCDINATVCLRSIRVELLRILRQVIRNYIHASKKLCKFDESEKLLSEMFSPEMSRLVLENDVCDDFLQLSTFKELWQLICLLRSEYLRLFLFHLSRPSRTLVFVYFDLLMKILFVKNCKTRLLLDLDFINHRGYRTEEKKVRNYTKTVSTTEDILMHLSFASEILTGDELLEPEKFEYVREILKKAVELLTPEKAVKPDLKRLSMSSTSSISESVNDTSSAENLSREEIYEGFPVISDGEQNNHSYIWQENNGNDATAKSVVTELKARLVERDKRKAKSETVQNGEVERMALVKSESEESPSVNKNYDITHLVQNTIDQNYLTTSTKNTIASISTNYDVSRSCVEMDLRKALILRKSAPSTIFLDDPESK
ncbi:unnamed protein product [Thelazia callipaeda]|uniref:Vezatin n=1 Tax=Thelazia callipaeda TaxID=103827 RepID=A0A0N5D0P1_THECL|nr:unnamed protein product [Thelazia callipaeda]